MPFLALWWMRRDSRAPRDVLDAAPGEPAGLLRRGFDFAAWGLQAAALLELPLFASGLMLSSEFLVSGEFYLEAAVEPQWPWIVAANVLALGFLVRWMRGSGRRAATGDVLGIQART